MRRKSVIAAMMIAIVIATMLTACGEEEQEGPQSPIVLEEQPMEKQPADTQPASANSADTQSGQSGAPSEPAVLPSGQSEPQADYVKPYIEKIREYEKLAEEDLSAKRKYDLIDLDGDDVPELVADNVGYFTSVFTFHDGKLYTVMDDWGYGTSGRGGYEYLPGKNVVRDFSTEYAGLFTYLSYSRMNASYEMESDYYLKISFFKDKNGNGSIDEGEYDETDASYYYGDQEISAEQYESYVIPGEFEQIRGKKGAEVMIAELSGEESQALGEDALYGTWEVTETGTFLSGIYAMGKEEQDAYKGFLLTYGENSFTFGEKAYEHEGYEFILYTPAELQEDFRIADSGRWNDFWAGRKYITCGTVLSDDFFFGEHFYLMDEDTMLIYMDGAFFTAEKIPAQEAS